MKIEELEDFKEQYNRSNLPKGMRKSIVKQIEKVQTVMENVQMGSSGYELGSEWIPIGDSGDNDPVKEYRRDAWDYGLNSGWSLKPASALRGWAGSKGVRYHSDDANLNRLIKRITTSPFSNAFDVIGNMDREFFDGGLVLKLTHLGGDQVIIRHADINEFQPHMTIVSDIDGETPWMHRTMHNTIDGKVLTYYPDVNFYPDADLMQAINGEIAEIAIKENAGSQIMWSTRIFSHRFNNGMPVFYPVTKFIKCLESVIMLQSAVLQSIAAVASYASIDDEAERYDAYVALNKARPGAMDGGDVQDRVEAILRDTDAGTAVTSGKISAVNLNIAMLQTTSALYKLLVDSVYNSIPGATPTDWAELHRFSLGDSGAQQSSKEVQAGLLRQSEHGGIYKRVIQGAFTMLIAAGELVPAVSVEQYPVNFPGGGMVNHFVIEYPEANNELQVSWPEITTRNFKDTVEAVVEGVTLGGRIGKPLGTPSDVAKMLEALGFELHLSSDDWEDYNLIANPVAGNTTNLDGNQTPAGQINGSAQENFDEALEKFHNLIGQYGSEIDDGK